MMPKFLPVCLLLLFGGFSSSVAQFMPQHWQYTQLDSARNKWGDYAKPDWLRYLGLDMADVTGDGHAEILAGKHFYLNPGNSGGDWQKFDLGQNVDGIFLTDVDGDDLPDAIAQALPAVYWLEATDKTFTKWEARKIAEVPATSHVNSQGFEKADVFAGGKPELLIAGNGDIYAIEIPTKRAEKGDWPVTLIGKNSSDEGIGTGDINGDGLIDIVAGRRAEGQYEPTVLVWWQNPGNKKAEWQATEIAETSHPIDRVEVADLNGDGRADVAIAEERYPGLEPDANLFWFENPAEGEKWPKHWLVTQYSMNNLDLADLDGDGDTDLITSEHKGPRLQLQAWENDGTGNFTMHVLDEGKEAHLGTQLFDLDSDGDHDLVSIGWDNYQYLHLWENKAAAPVAMRWKHLSSIDKGLPLPSSGREQTAALAADVDKDGDADILLTLHGFTPSGEGPPTYNVTHFGVALRWRGHVPDGRQPHRQWFPLGAQGEFLLKNDLDSCQWRVLLNGGKGTPWPYAQKRNRAVTGEKMRIKAQVVTLPNGQSRYRFKQWLASEPEPAGWDVEALEPGSEDFASGALCLVPHNSDVTIHRVSVRPLPPTGE